MKVRKDIKAFVGLWTGELLEMRREITWLCFYILLSQHFTLAIATEKATTQVHRSPLGPGTSLPHSCFWGPFWILHGNTEMWRRRQSMWWLMGLELLEKHYPLPSPSCIVLSCSLHGSTCYQARLNFNYLVMIAQWCISEGSPSFPVWPVPSSIIVAWHHFPKHTSCPQALC